MPPVVFWFAIKLSLLFCAYTRVVPLQKQASVELHCQYYTAADASHEYCMHYATVFSENEFWQPLFLNNMISAFCLRPWCHRELSGIPEVLPGQWVSVVPPLSGMCPKHTFLEVSWPVSWATASQCGEPPSWPSHCVSEGQPWQPNWFACICDLVRSVTPYSLWPKVTNAQCLHLSFTPEQHPEVFELLHTISFPTQEDTPPFPSQGPWS